MKKSKPLTGETVVFTGTPKSRDALKMVEDYGGTPISLPLIQVEELIETTDALRLEACATYDWLIFTSQSAVMAFKNKLERHHVSVESIPSNIAAIGTKTAAALEKIGFTVRFIPTVFSADVFVKEFQPTEDESRSLLFLRGSMAGPTIREELPFKVDDWTIYHTEYVTDHAEKLIRLIQERENLSVLFASPSAVDVFTKKVVPITGWDGYTTCAIGHITERALVKAGAKVEVRPDIYTLQALVEKLANRKDVQRES